MIIQIGCHVVTRQINSAVRRTILTGGEYRHYLIVYRVGFQLLENMGGFVVYLFKIKITIHKTFFYFYE